MISRRGSWPPVCAWPGCNEDRAPRSDVCTRHEIVRAETRARLKAKAVRIIASTGRVADPDAAAERIQTDIEATFGPSAFDPQPEEEYR